MEREGRESRDVKLKVMEAMQDDVYVLVDDGWEAGRQIDEDEKNKIRGKVALFPRIWLLTATLSWSGKPLKNSNQTGMK